VDKERLRKTLGRDQAIVDLVNLDKARRPEASEYEGICW
jgi:hypothetical protein